MVMRYRDESGVAMVIVLFVAAVLTVVTSTAAFVTMRELGANADDSRGAQALAYSEAGIDRTIASIEGGVWSWKALASSGCDDATLAARNLNPANFPLAIGADVAADGRTLESGTGGDIGPGGRYRAVLTTCLGAGGSIPRPKGEHELSVRSIGEHPTARREILQRILVEPQGLPVGLFASTLVNSGGDVDFRGISLVSTGPVERREKMRFAGIDPYYEKSDFYPCSATNTPAGCFTEDGNDVGDMPAAAHTSRLISCTSFCPGPHSPNSNLEHPTNPVRSPNCFANKGSEPRGQSMWDGDNWTTSTAGAAITANTCGWVPPAGWSGNEYPPTSRFTDDDATRLSPSVQLSEDDLSALKTQAQARGIYCGTEISGTFGCFRQGAPRNTMLTSSGVKVTGELQPQTVDLQSVPKIFVAYIDFPAGTSANLVNWAGDMKYNNVSRCVDGAEHMSATIIVRNGNLTGSGGIFANGTIIANDGYVDINGNWTFNGTIIAKQILITTGGTGDRVTLDDCWVTNMQTSGIEVSPLSWSEIDR